jgi:hypothetical protein
MAGTLFGLPLSQRIDLNGIPSVGWLLYLYQANTSTPVNSYQDTALTVLNPWPLQADAYGMQRQFWLADGSYRARATSSDGSITYFDQQTILALGASSGAAPSGGVDPTAIYQTGDTMWTDRQGTRIGWVRDTGSSATERPNNDTQPLFEFLWNTFPQTICPVFPSRGASSLADWNTGTKTIATPDKRGYIPGGLDDMGNTAAGRYAGVPIVSGDAVTAGSILGEALHTTLVGEMPLHTHAGTTGTDAPDHTHTYTSPLGSFEQAGATPNTAATTSGTTGGASVRHQHPFTTDNGTGGGGPHNNVQKTILGTFYRKL